MELSIGENSALKMKNALLPAGKSAAESFLLLSQDSKMGF